LQVGALGSAHPALCSESVAGYAIIANSTANLAAKLDGVTDSKHLEVAQVNAAPSGYGRWHVLSDGRAYLIDAAGKRHDLSVQHKQCISGHALAMGENGETWQGAAYPAGATAAAITCSKVHQFNFTAGKLDAAYGRWTWQAGYSLSPPELTQAQIATGVAFRKFGDGQDRSGNCRIEFKARLRINDPENFDALLLSINDSNTGLIVSNVLSQVTMGSWTEVALSSAGSDISSWNANLSACVWAQGKQHTEEGTYATSIDIEWLSIEQWVN
jgi:hypothetical protein